MEQKYDLKEEEEKGDEKITIEFEDELEDVSSLFEEMRSPDFSIMKTERFDLDMAYHLQSDKDLDQTTKKKLKAMIKAKKKKNEIDVNYVIGSKMKSEYSGRWIAKLGLQLLPRDIRNALSEKYYWDLDIVNCQVEILSQMASRYGWTNKELNNYCQNREKMFSEMIEQSQGRLDRDTLKQRFISLLFGGRPKCDDPNWIRRNFHPEVKIIMENISRMYTEIFNKCKRYKKDNPIGSCCAHVLQEEEKKCLMALDKYLTMNERSLETLIHDGGLIRKLHNEKNFPKKLITGAEEFIKKHTGYDLKLAIKPIVSTIKIEDTSIPKGKSYEEIKREFEKYNFKCMNDGLFYNTEDQEIKVRTKAELKIVYENLYYTDINKKTRQLEERKFLSDKDSKWFSDPEIRTYKRVGLYPPPAKCPLGTYNTWRGFNVERMEYDESKLSDEQIQETKRRFDIIIDHLFLLCNKDKDVLEYELDCQAQLFQQPGHKIGICKLFKSTPGLGKGLRFTLYKRMIGGAYCGYSAKPGRDVFGNFNNKLRGKLFFILDEIKGGYKYAEEIKDMVTGDENHINAKNVNIEDEPSYLRLDIYCDNGYPIKLDEKDRRFLPIESFQDPKTKEEYTFFKDVIIEDDLTLRYFYDFLMNRNITGKDWINSRPKTELEQDLKMLSRPKELQFIIDLVPNIDQDIYTISAYDLFNKYTGYLFNIGCTEYKTTIQKFGIKLKNFWIDGLEKENKNGKGTVYTFNTKVVMKWLKNKGYIEGFKSLLHNGKNEEIKELKEEKY